ncbi:AraC family transcriptional regulator [Fibrella aquatilis]|uniref:Helix-turn-helix transcriptional regulator n=1 Tax=Fibrella aquatilis TaxID=2817059 RepID=A0A939K006_9BACT|nr:AraC family transcriptional regulator [Fibrella aquatilis]MBO0931973.1 helix-turn-helix transcriptional regulator [Fibrella aquatilis]
MIEAWSVGPLVLERYEFEPGQIVPLPPHAHEAIQVCLNSGSGGQYRYRGGTHSFAPESLTIINSGEAHAPGYKGEFAQPTSFRMLYLPPTQLQTLAHDLMPQPVQEPFFVELIQGLSPAARLLRLAHDSLQFAPSNLSTETYLLLFQAALLYYHVGDRVRPRRWTDDHPALRQVRDFIHDQYHVPITLAELADVACLSPYHFVRLFTRRYGVAPHQYLNQVRIDRAKPLLLAGHRVGDVAKQVGYFDNSHFTRHFHRIVGLSPGQYRR